MPVSQFDISEFVGDLPNGQPVSRATLVATARARGARPAVLDVLRHLRHPAYRHCCDLMADVADLPRVFDPWEASAIDQRCSQVAVRPCEADVVLRRAIH